MAQIKTTKTHATATYTVLRAIFLGGKRIEVGDPVDLTPLQYAEAHNAGKVGPFVAKPAPAKQAKAAPQKPEETTP